MPPTYVADYAEELKQLGDLNFAVRYGTPVLVVQGIAGTLKEGRPAGVTTMVSTGADDLAQTSMLIGRVFPIRKSPQSPPGPISVGRTSDNDLAIPEYSISKRHCFFTLQGRDVLITDCGSTNGTLLNGLPLPPKKAVPLPGDATLVIGRFAFAYRLSGSFLKMVQGG